MAAKDNIVEFFPHDKDMRHDPKVNALRIKFPGWGYTVWNMLLETFADSRSRSVEWNELNQELLAADFLIDKALLVDIVNYAVAINLLQVNDGYLMSRRFQERFVELDDLREKRSRAGRLGAKAKWEGLSEEELESQNIRTKRIGAAKSRGTHTEKEWNELKSYFGECVKCGSKQNVQKDHIVPLCVGGSDSITNVQPLCGSCNSAKGLDSTDYRISWCASHGKEMPGKWMANPQSAIANCSNIKESKEKKRKENYSSSCCSSSFQAGTTEEGKEEQQQEQIISFFFFKNFKHPEAEARRLEAWNNTGGRRWADMDITQRLSSAELWTPKEQGARFQADFPAFWAEVVSLLGSGAETRQERREALSDELGWRRDGDDLTLRCGSRLCGWLEDHCDDVRNIISRHYGKGKRLRYMLVDRQGG